MSGAGSSSGNTPGRQMVCRKYESIRQYARCWLFAKRIDADADGSWFGDGPLKDQARLCGTFYILSIHKESTRDTIIPARPRYGVPTQASSEHWHPSG
jgi:hypothetical protein